MRTGEKYLCVRPSHLFMLTQSCCDWTGHFLCYDIKASRAHVCECIITLRFNGGVNPGLFSQDFANTGARQGSNHNEPGKDDHSEAVAAAISITSRYIASLRRRRRGDEDSPCNLFGDAENTREHGTATTSGQQRTDCCGQDAADASITIGNPEWLAVLKTWETAVVASQEESRVGLMPRGSDGSTGAKEVDGAVDMRQDTFSNDEKNTVCPENARENIITLGNSLCPEFVTQARAMLQELDAVDPQCTLLGRANAWVVKPPGLSCGRGITATSSLRGLLAACRELKWKAVVQKYVERPLVVQVRVVRSPRRRREFVAKHWTQLYWEPITSSSTVHGLSVN